MKKRNKHIGSSLDDFLKEEGVLEETRAAVQKETLARQVWQAMENENVSANDRDGPQEMQTDLIRRH